MSARPETRRLTTRDVAAMRRRGEAVAMLTAYDHVMAGLVDAAGIEIVLVGDSLGNVVLGHETTVPVTLEDMIRHGAAVVRGTSRAMVVVDLPFGTATDPDTALRAGIRVMQESLCQGVKIEGGASLAPTVRRLTGQGIPVVGHIGLTPQAVHQMGGYYRHGKTAPAAKALIDAALALQDAGAFALVLEMVVPEVAAEITGLLDIPTIGIGSGEGCAGQVLVVNDLLGLNTRPAPSFARPRANLAEIIDRAVRDYVGEVKATRFAATAAPEAPRKGRKGPALV